MQRLWGSVSPGLRDGERTRTWGLQERYEPVWVLPKRWDVLWAAVSPERYAPVALREWALQEQQDGARGLVPQERQDGLRGLVLQER